MTTRKSRSRAPADLLVEELEPRVLLSAGIESALFADASNADVVLNEPLLPPAVATPLNVTSTADSADSVRREIAFVDANVPDVEQLVAQLQASAQDNDALVLEVVLLDAQRDGVEQIAEALVRYGDLDAVHVFSHGSDGALMLGNARLDAQTLTAYRGLIGGWGDALDADADILFYGCDLAAGEDGRLLIDALADLTGADIAASTDVTGHTALGGDWDLEVASGRIEADIAVDKATRDAWRGALTTATFREGDAGYVGTQDTELRSISPNNDFGAATTITIESNGGASGEQGLIRFDNIIGLGAGQIPPGATITSATLTFEATDAGSTVNLHRMLQSWNESSTWNSMSGGIQLDDVEAAAVADSTVPSPGTGTLQFTGLEATLQAWANGDTNYGWAIVNSSNDGVDVASSENGTSGFRPVLEVTFTAGSGVVSGTIYEDVDGDANLADAVGAVGVDVDLYLDDGDGIIDGGDSLAGSTATDGVGNYSFSGLADATYWVVVDSTTIASSAGYNGGFAIGDVWAEQTYGVANAVSFNGAYSYLGSAGALYGGMQGEVADDASALTSAEHVTRAVVSGADVTGVNSAFSFNVVTRTGDGDIGPGNRTLQGSLRQFIGNSNAIAGTQSSLFAISTADSNYNGSGNGEYTINLTAGWDGFLTDTVILDATTQAGYAGTPIVELDVSGATGATAGIAVRANDTLVRGFSVYGSPDEGIEVDGSTGFGDNNTVQDNWVGLTVGGVVIGNSDNGLLIAVDATGNLFEGNIAVGSTNAGMAIRASGADGNFVQGNYFGVGPDGLTAMPNARGVDISDSASNNLIGGATAAERNVISGNNGNGIRVRGATTTLNTVSGNYIGVDASGTVAVGNQFDGIYVADSSSGNIFGGSAPGEGNVISGNVDDGIEIGNSNVSGSIVQGNFIGTNAAGTAAIGNGRHGVVIYSGANNTQIGGGAANERNVISGNGSAGIVIDGAAGATTINNQILGNYIGTNAAGTAALANFVGVQFIDGARNNAIGGTGAGEGNLISGNSIGINIQGVGSNVNTVRGNLIGTDVTGLAPLANSSAGISLQSQADGTVIGGTTAAARNVISANGNGIQLFSGVINTTIAGNYIGVGADGSTALGNTGNGIVISDADNNMIGGTVGGAGNVIAHNNVDGVSLISASGTGNSILGNSIYGNTQLGIDLLGGVEDGFGVSDNDTLDADAGPNNLQNYPLLISANSDGAGNVYVAGTMQAAAGSTYRVEFFASASADASGHGQGEVFLGFLNVTTDGTGKASFSTTFAATVAPGAFLSTTATAADGSTSEFSANADALRMGVLVVDTTLDSVDGNVTSIPALLANRGADQRISLREALLATNATANAGVPDEIHFNLQLDDPNRFYYQDDGSGGSLSLVANATLPDADIGDFDPDYPAAAATWFRLQPTSALPDINDALIIDGFTQDGASANTLTVGSDAVYKIVIDGDLSGNVNGFVINAAGSGLHGLAITGDFFNAIVVNANNVDVSGNYIGTDVTGSQAGANLEHGVVFSGGAAGGILGGSTPAARNVISGTLLEAVILTGATTNAITVEGNYIGTSAQGDAALANASDGIALYDGAYDNVIRGNLISGNNRGIVVDGDTLAVTNNTIVGNLIGTDATGALALANVMGIWILRGATNTTIGGTSAADRNIISGNTGLGVRIQSLGTTGNVIIGNYIGTDITGATALGNGGAGVRIGNSASGNTVGGTAAGAGNVISSNVTGIDINDAYANVIEGNLIGTDSSGTASLGNSVAGVQIQNLASNNVVGGTAAGAGNVIAHTSGVGVLIVSDAGTGNAVLGNAIYDNTGLGIEHQPGGLVPPDLATAQTDGVGSVSIVGSIDALPSTTYRIEFFANASGDPSGAGEGEVYLGFINVTTDGAGRGDFTEALSAVVAPGAVISATATDAANSTSEFAANIVATQTAPTVDLDADDSSGQGGSDFATTFTEDGGPVAVADSDAIVTDPDSTIDWMTVTITNALDGALETLAASTGATGIVASYDAGTGVLTLSGTTAAANYQLVLQSVTYDNASEDPNTTSRVLEVVASDGTLSSAIARTTISVTAINDAPVLTPAAPSLPTISEDDVANGGQQVGVLLGASVSDVDSGAAEGIAITGLASGNGTWQYSLDGGTTWSDIGAVANSSALLLRSTDFIRFVPDGENADAASFTYRAWDQTGGAAGALADTTTSGGQSAFSTATDSASITVTAVNDAPVLTPASPSLPAISEDDVANGGQQVGVLLGASVSDVDSGAVEGIAIVSLSPGNGTWQYSIDGGSSWTDMPAVAVNNALLLRATDFIRFVPDGENGESTGFGFRAWDQTSGTAGGFGDTTVNGGQSAFSSTFDAASITVTAVNDAPVLTPASPSLPTITEDDVANSGLQIGLLLGASVTDVDSGAVEGIAITGLSSGNGTWQYSLDGGATWSDVGVVANNSALLLRSADFVRFVPDGENADAASFTYRAWDQTSGSAGTTADTTTNGGQSAFSAATDNASITVTAINDAPVLTPAAPTLPTITEDEVANGGVLVSTLLGASVFDPDTGAVEGIAVNGLTSGNGTWQYSIDGGASWLDVGVVSDSSALLLRDTDLVRFVPDAQNADSASFTFRAWDQTSGTQGTKVDASTNGGTTAFSTSTDSASITVTALNDAPVIAGLSGDSTTYTAGDGVIVVEQGGDVVVSDVDSADFDTGDLTVSFLAGSDPAEDVLSIRDQGTGAGQIGFDGTSVTYGGVLIGTASGGSAGADLAIVFNANATTTAVAALIENITYENTDTVNPTTGARAVRFELRDGDGGAGASYDTTVNLPGVNTATILDRFGIEAYSNNDGTENWTSNWIEVDSSGGGATGGRIEVRSGRLDFQVANAGNNIYREANLANAISATLSFNYNNALGNSATLHVEVSGDGGASYTTVAIFDASTNTGTGNQSIDISAFTDTNTRVRFYVVSGETGSGVNGFWVDNVQIEYTYNTDPVVTLPGPAVNYTENDGAVVIDSLATVADAESTDFDGGVLTVDFTAGGTANDRLSVRDQGTGIGQVGVSGTDVTYEGVIVGTFSGGIDGSTPLTITFNTSADQAAVQAIARNITYENVSDDPITTARTVRFVLTDGDGGTSVAASETITLTATNDAPVLTPAAPSLPAITEDDVANSGVQVSTLLGGSVSDVDGGAVEGIAITGLSSGNGAWQYSLDGGTSWLNVGAVANNSALLLRSTDLLRFVPDGENADSASVNYRAWDRTSGSAGALADTTTNGNQSPFSAATDTASITVTAVNDAPVLTPAAPTLTTITEDDTTNGGVLVSTLLGASVSDVDTGAVEGIAITGLTSGNGTWQYSLDGGASWLDVGAVSDSLALLLRDTDRVRFVPDAQNADTASFTFRAWDQTNGSAGTTADATTNGGQSPFSAATDTASITVTAVNDAPVLTPAAPGLPTINEDETTNAGVLISTLLGASVSDVDTAAVEGIAITSLTSGNGTWQYSLDGGASWSNVGAVANNAALLLRDTDQIRFIPDAQNADSASFNFRAWDQSTGTAGTTADTTTNGGQSAFSAATDTASITVTAINDAPVLISATPTLPTITEDDTANGGVLVATLLGASVSDVDGGAVEGIAITGLTSGNGTWQYSTDGGASWVNAGAVSNNAALLLRDTDRVRFVPDAQNADTASFTFRAWDQSTGTAGTTADATTNGGQSPFSAATDTASITVTAVNDAPVLTPVAPTLPTITEDDIANGGVLVSTLLVGSVSDVDSGAIEGIAITSLASGNGTWQYSLDGGASWVNAGAVSNNAALLLRDTDRVRFVPDAQNADSASFTFRAWDQSAGTEGSKVDTSTNGATSAFSTATDSASISVTALNDAPLLAPAAPTLPTITEDDVANAGVQISTLLGGSVSDVDTGAVEGIAITSLTSGNGTWQYSIDGGASWSNVGAVANNSALLLRDTDRVRFVPDAQNADTASFTFRAWDQTSGSAGTTADTTTNGGQSAFSAATDSASITVTAINDAPVLTPATPALPTITEDETTNAGVLVSTLLGASVSDVDAGAIEGLAITGLNSSNGTWQYSLDGGASWLDVGAVSDSLALLLRDTDRVRFVPDAQNADTASFTFRAWDQSAGTAGTTADTTTNGGQSAFSATTDTASITVTAINDAPVLTPATPALPTITEDDIANGGVLVSTLLGASVSDVDTGAVEGIAITSLASGNGTWQYSLDGGTTWLNVGAVSDASALLLRDSDRVRFVPDGNNADSASFTFRAWDRTSGVAGTTADSSTNGGTTAFSSATDSASIVVTAVNEAPVLTPAAPTLPTITEDEVANAGVLVSTLLGASVSDVDTGAVEGIAITALSSGNGTWQYSIDGGASWLVVGAVSDNSALLLRDTDRVRFVPDAQNADTASFTFRAWDQTNGSAGTTADTTTNGGQSAFSAATDTASITVTAINDAPVLISATPTLPTITEDDTANGGVLISTLLGASVSDVDTGAVEGIAITGLTSGNGTWQYSVDGGVSWSNVGAVSDSAALLLRDTDRVRFVPDAQNADAASFTFRAWDQTNGSAGTTADTTTNGGQSPFSAATDTASITVTAVNDAPILIPAGPTLPTITEDDTANGGVVIATLLGASVSDVDAGAVEGVAITALFSGNGTWQYSTDGGASWLNVGAVSDSAALLLRDTDLVRFVPDALNADTASVTFRAWDQTSGSAGTTADTTTNGGQSPFSAATDTASITVTAVNDAPVLTPAGPTLPTITEDYTANGGVLVSTLLGASVADVDTGAAEGIAITALSSGSGTWQYSTDGGASWLNVGAVSDSAALLLRDTDRVRFVPDAQNADTASFTFRAWDQSAGTAGTTADTTTNGGQSAFSATTDTASITVTAINDAPVLTPATPALPTITEDDIANGGVLVSTLLGASVSDVDTGAVEGIAITSLASGNGTWQYSTDGGASWLDVGAVSDSAALLLRDTDLVRFVPDALNADTASVTFRAWDQTSGTAGTRVDASINGATTGFSVATDSATITVTDVNDAPVLNPAITLALSVVAEDDSNPSGDTVAAILASGGTDPLTDVDLGAVEGIAVVGVDNSNGIWQYSIDGGVSWLDFGAVSTTNAVLLDSAASVRFVPAAGYIGSGGVVTFHGWDASVGATGQTGVDVSIAGGSSAFSTLAGVASVAVTAVNDTPTTGGIAAVIVDEDAAPTVVDLHAAFDDIEDTDAALSFVVAGNSNPALFSSLAIDPIGGTLTLAYAPDAFGSAVLTVRATDTDGAFVETSFTVTVNAVNDLPTTSGIADLSGSEDDPALTIDLGTLFDDIEDGAAGLTFSVTGNSNPALVTTAVDAATGIATFTPVADANGTTTLTIRATDTAGGVVQTTFTLTLAAINDAPTAQSLPTVTVNEDAPGLLVDLAPAFADVDDPLTSLIFSLVGTGGDAVIETTLDTATGTLSLQFLEEQSGDATVTVRATDAAGAFADTVLQVSVAPVDDAPGVIVPGAQSINENEFVLFSTDQGNALRLTDADGGLVTVTLSVTSGTLVLADIAGLTFADGSQGGVASLTFSGTADAVNAALDGLLVQPNEDFAGIATVFISTQAAGGDVSTAQLDVIVLELPDEQRSVSKLPLATVTATTQGDAADDADATDDSQAALEFLTSLQPEPAPALDFAAVPGMLPGSTMLRVFQALIELDDRNVTGTAVNGETGLADITRRLLALGSNNSSTPLLFNDAVFDALDVLKKRFDESGDTALAQSEMIVAVASGVTLTLSAGFVTWLMRAGALLTSLLSTTPVWRGFDPLPVLGTGRDDEDDDFFLDVPGKDNKAEALFDDLREDKN